MTDLEQKISSLEERVSKLEKIISEPSPTAKTTGHTKQQSIREFLSSKELDGDTKKTLVIAYFYEVNQNNGPFNTDDIKAGFSSAKFKTPTNINDRVNQNIKLGFIMEHEEKKDGKKAWVLTDSGEKEIENNLNKNNEQ